MSNAQLGGSYVVKVDQNPEIGVSGLAETQWDHRQLICTSLTPLVDIYLQKDVTWVVTRVAPKASTWVLIQKAPNSHFATAILLKGTLLSVNGLAPSQFKDGRMDGVSDGQTPLTIAWSDREFAIEWKNDIEAKPI